VRRGLTFGKLLADSSVGTPATQALVALMAFQAARLPTRVDSSGELVLLEDQDPKLWDQQLIAMGVLYFRDAPREMRFPNITCRPRLLRHMPVPFVVRVQIGRRFWGFNNELMVLNPSPVVA